jgi:hypothetical protein
MPMLEAISELWMTAVTILPKRVRFKPHQTRPPTNTAKATSSRS